MSQADQDALAAAVARRSPTDGRPFYCRLCGVGLAKFMACELLACELEAVETAEARAQLWASAGRP